MKFTFTGTRGSSSECIQLSKIYFFNGATIVKPVSYENPGGKNPPSQDVAKLFVDNKNDKWLDLDFYNHGSVTVLCFGFPSAQALTEYQFLTAEDWNSRDPTSWKVEVSKAPAAAHSGVVAWEEVDKKHEFPAPEGRNTEYPTMPLNLGPKASPGTK